MYVVDVNFGSDTLGRPENYQAKTFGDWARKQFSGMGVAKRGPFVRLVFESAELISEVVAKSINRTSPIRADFTIQVYQRFDEKWLKGQTDATQQRDHRTQP